MYGIIGSASGQARPRAAGCTASSSPPSSPGRARPRRACESDPTSSRPASSREPCRPPGRLRRCAASIDGSARQHVLPVDDVDPFARDERREELGEPRVQPLVLEVVADERHGRRRRAELERRGSRRRRPRDAVSASPGRGCTTSDVVAARPQAARQLVGAPAAAAADRRERVGDDAGRSSACSPARARRSDRASSARQCAAQLKSRTARARAAAPERAAAAPDRSALRARRRAPRAAADRRAAPSRSWSTSAAMPGSAGATTGRPAAMYSKIFSGDQ